MHYKDQEFGVLKNFKNEKKKMSVECHLYYFNYGIKINEKKRLQVHNF